ncbi:MAG: class I adenylate-forming enzyme family protein [Alphaproteobacteria bacterium]
MQTTPRERIESYTQQGWWENKTLQQLVSEIVSDEGDRLALVDPSNRSSLVDGAPMRLTYAEILRAVDKIGSWLYSAGLRQGDTILVQMPNTVEIVMMYFACASLGLIISPVAMQYGQFELDHISDVIAPKGYVAFRDFNGKPFAVDQSQAMKSSCKTLLFGDKDFNLQSCEAASPEYLSYAQALNHDPNDILTICWTSGTTGRSKGVPRSHNQWMAVGAGMEDFVAMPKHSTYLNPFPFINMAAIGGFMFFWLRNRGTMVLHHPFDPHVFLTQLQDEKIEYALAPPALLIRLIETKDVIKANYDLSTLKVIASGSAPLSAHMIEGFKTHFDIDVVNVFGSNEGVTLLSSAIEVPDSRDRAIYFPRFGRDDLEWKNPLSAKIKTKLLDVDTGEEITGPGKTGELCIDGAAVFDGYYKSPEDNANAFTSDGYFRTGDLFQITGDKNEFYHFVGRCKALIVRGGVNISPEELDELLLGHPAVREGAVAPYPDKVMGEKVCAVVVLNAGQTLTLEDIKNYLAEKKVAKFKWPERLHVMNALPRNPMNKVVRHELEKLIS